MNRKRVGQLSVVFFLVLMSSFVFAAEGDEVLTEKVDELGTDIAGGAGNLFSSALTFLMGGDKEILTRIFLAIILGMVVYSIITTMFKDSGRMIQWGITGAITALALIGLPEGFLRAVLTSYGAMGATILVMIPFIIVLIFSLRARSVLIARVTWIYYSTYYLSLYLYKLFIEAGGDKGWLNVELIPYLAGLIAGVIVLFGIRWFRDLMFRGKIESVKETGVQHIENAKLLRKLQKKELEDVYGSDEDL